MAQASADLTDIAMSQLVEQVLPFRSSKYLEDFCEKLLGEGIAAPADLLRVSKEALETKLSTHAAFNFIEMADAMTLRQSIDKAGKDTSAGAKPAGLARSRSPPRRARSFSDDRNRGRDFCQGGGGGGGFRNNSRPRRDGYRGGFRDGYRDRGNFRDRRPPPKRPQEKPELWAAVEGGDESRVQQLLAAGKDPEEKFEGWTPLMKAAEEGQVECMKLLLEKKVDIEASNRKGRTALSFAAAPSDNGSERRNTPIGTLRLLLESGADPKRRDERGITPKDYAQRSKPVREDSLAIFEEFAHMM